MPKIKTPSDEICRWLKVNGLRLGGLTGQDMPALRAAAEILNGYTSSDYNGRQLMLIAFRAVVQAMQPTMRALAYHAIAREMNWKDREIIWQAAQLEPLANPGRCTYEP